MAIGALSHMLVAVLLLAGCSGKRAAPTQPSAPIPIAAASAAPRAAKAMHFGGGYQGTPWGISRKAAVARWKSKGTVVEDADGFSVGLDDNSDLDFAFYQDHLLSVSYAPVFQDEPRERVMLLEALEKKFGPSTPVDGLSNNLGPLVVHRWDDGETVIVFHYSKPPLEGLTSVDYLSKELVQARDAGRDVDGGKSKSVRAEELSKHL